jgi:hypothetical protein
LTAKDSAQQHYRQNQYETICQKTHISNRNCLIPNY